MIINIYRCCGILFLFIFFHTLLFAEELISTNKPYRDISLEDSWVFKRDTAYYQSSVFKNLRLVYSEDFKTSLTPFLDYTKQSHLKLSEVFTFDPYFRNNNVIFVSPRIQVSNGLAATYPLSSIIIFPSIEANFMDKWAFFNWYESLIVHEMTHIYQMSQNSKWDRRLRWILGPLSYRNVLLNSFILEGNAVFNESMYGSGGRLFSGWVRALVFSQIKQGYTLKRLLQAYPDSFSNAEKYLHGGYFFAYLHSQYGVKDIHRFFLESGKFLPLGFYGLSSSLRRTFSKDLETLFEEYKKYYAPLARRQKSSSGKTLIQSQTVLPMNSNKEKIYFLISDNKSPPELVIFDKKTGSIKRKRKNLPLGKVFYRGKEYYSSSNANTSSTSVENSLFKEGLKPVKKYNSQQVMDFYKDKYISLDKRESHFKNSLLVNGFFYDHIHSSALMDHKGRIYYFKQEGDIRTLYRDKKPLMSFRSYYAYPVEADKDGLYFIGATKYGTSLFVYKESGGIFRLSSSDTINSARKIEADKFLVSEITPTHYEYKIIKTQARFEKPVIYDYSFQKEDIFKNSRLKLHKKQQDKIAKKYYKKQTSVEGKSSFDKISPLADHLKSHKFYNAFKNLNLSQIFFFVSKQYNTEPYFSFSSHFVDPLEFNSLLLNNILGLDRHQFSLSYTYRRYRPKFSFSLFYDERTLDREYDESLIQSFKGIGFLETSDLYYPYQANIVRKKDSIFYRDRALDISLSYPLIKHSDWGLSFTKGFQFGQKQFHNEVKYFPFWFYKSKAWQNYIQYRGSLLYDFAKKYSYAYSYHKKRAIQLVYNVLRIETPSNHYNTYFRGQMKAFFVEEIGTEWFVSLAGEIVKDLWNKEAQELSLREEKSFQFDSFKYSSFEYDAQDLYRFHFQILKVLNYSYYPLKLPFAIRRWAPLAGMSFLSLKVNSQNHNFLIPFVGLESEVNFLHPKVFFKSGVSGDFFVNLSSFKGPPHFEFSVWLRGDF